MMFGRNHCAVLNTVQSPAFVETWAQTDVSVWEWHPDGFGHSESGVLSVLSFLTTSLCVCGQVSCSSCPAAPSMVVTTLPGSRIIRQSSQPESSAPCCRTGCVHNAVVSTSLKQLRDHSDGGIAGIAADSLRINGAMRNFKQVLHRLNRSAIIFLLCKYVCVSRVYNSLRSYGSATCYIVSLRKAKHGIFTFISMLNQRNYINYNFRNGRIQCFF